MKKFVLFFISCFLVSTICYASGVDDIFNGIKSGVDIFSDVNRLREQVIQTNVQKRQLENKQTTDALQNSSQDTGTDTYTETTTVDNYTNFSEKDEGTAFSAKSNYVQGNVLLKKGQYSEAIDYYNNAKELFQAIGDNENVQKTEQALEHAYEMQCEFGDYCM